MTKEQEEAIEIIDKMIKSYIEADDCGLSNNDFKDEIRALQTCLSLLKEQEEIIKDKYIPKQVIIDKMERHKFAYEELGKILEVKKYESEELKEFDFNLRITEDRIVQALQELLEGGNENG